VATSRGLLPSGQRRRSRGVSEIQLGKDGDMRRPIPVVVFFAALIVAAAAVAQQNMLLDYAADQMVQKFQGSTCEQLKAKAKEPQTDKAKEAAAFLRNDAQAREAFVKKVAAPVLNKMFECGMIP
jgi:hypothetical protein